MLCCVQVEMGNNNCVSKKEKEKRTIEQWKSLESKRKNTNVEEEPAARGSVQTDKDNREQIN